MICHDTCRGGTGAARIILTPNNINNPVHTLPQRKPIRFPGFDYSHGGYYMVTICTQNRIEYFGDIKKGHMTYNQFGLIVNRMWHSLPFRHPYITLDEYIVMPNHFHGIIYIDRESMYLTRAAPVPPLHTTKSLHQIVGGFKARSTKLIRTSGLPEFQWQRSFFDNIIRDDISLENFRRYIRDSPKKWWRDRNNQ